MNKHALAITVLGLFAAAACKSDDSSASYEVSDPATAHPVTLSVGMTCDRNCPPRVRTALGSVHGVESVEVDYEAQTATVMASADADPKAMCAALEKAGYTASVSK